MELGRQFCAFIAFRDGSWAVTDPSGRYDGSNGGKVRSLHWVKGLKVSKLAKYRRRHYAKCLLGKIWRGDPLPKVL